MMILMISATICFASPSKNNHSYYGKCYNSYFITKDTDILTTMNTLIENKDLDQKQFTCNQFSFMETKNKEYVLDVDTVYNNIPYLIQFTGIQTTNNNGRVMIPSNIILSHYDGTPIKTYSQNQIIGVCDIDLKDDNKFNCLVALQDTDHTIAIKIRFK